MAAANRRVALIFGMHRSGTSAVARVVNLLGAALPKKLLEAGPGNEAGHWEPIELMSLHDQMLAEAGSRWDDFRPFNITALPEERIQFYRREIERLIIQEYNDEPWFVLKEPRICRFPALYLEVFQELGIEVLVILTFRNPLSVIGSLGARDQMTEEYAGLLWLRHWLDAEAGTRQQQRAVIEYEMLIEQPTGVVDELRNWLKRMGITPREDNDRDIIGFLNPALRHHIYSATDLNADNGIAKWIKDAYHEAKNLTFEAHSERAQDALNAIQREFLDASALIGDAIFCELRSARSKVTELEKLETKNRELDRQLLSAQSEITQLQSKVTELEHGIEVWSAQSKKLETRNRELDGQIAEILTNHSRQITEILTSHSWRMTAPLRKTSRAISKAAAFLRTARHGKFGSTR
jgi:hypothetical protein